tara:strand:- start:16820 stop:18757 length:1938 start_codon:yes stop_codon:yes gene_type:complete
MTKNRFSKVTDSASSFRLDSLDGDQDRTHEAKVLSVTEHLAHIALDDALTAADWKKINGGPHLVLIETFSAGMADDVYNCLRERPTRATIETVTEKKKVLGKMVAGGESVLDHLEKGEPVIVITQDPTGLLSPVILAAADVKVVIPELSVSQVRNLIRKVTGHRVRALTQADVSGLDIADFQASIRPGMTGGECRKVLARCSEARRVPTSNVGVPSLDEMILVRQVEAWTNATRATMQAVMQSELEPKNLPFALFEGIPGGGKTTLAAALALAEGWEFVSTSIQEWFDSSDGNLGGVSKASRQFFEKVLTSRRPVVGFIDEIDSLPNRTTMDARDASWWTPIITGVLTDIDKCRHANRPILLIGATNHFRRLDAALIRPGRLETRVSFTTPNLQERAEMFAMFLNDHLDDEEMNTLARLANGATPAQIESWANAAKSNAVLNSRDLDVSDVMALIAPEHRSKDMLWEIALHEAGHAIVSLELGVTIGEVSLLLVGSVGGSVSMNVREMLMTRDDVETLATAFLGGRAADVVLGGGANAGAASDLELANSLIDDAINRYGLYGSLRTGHGVVASEANPRAEQLLEQLAKRAEDIVLGRRKDVLAVAKALVKSRVLMPHQVTQIVSGRGRRAVCPITGDPLPSRNRS